ncbi:MAG: hypothetical protein JW860_00350, partial [Sedimentisphaerales bacterium]|nr:hypothetical protein [Sedimentisphaerales bacterium]
MPDLTTKLHNLKERIRSYRRVIVAYSGGVDSTFLLKVALDSLGPDKVLAAIGRSASLSGTEFDTAVKIAQELRADLEVVFPQEMSSPDYKANPPNRCYYCKTHLYQVLNDMARKRDYDVVLSGNNADDLDDFRPGHQAGSEMGVASPLQEAQLTKDD